jgi:hypothetical protein
MEPTRMITLNGREVINPAILRSLASTHEDLAETAEILEEEVSAAYHATRASELNALADNLERRSNG